MMSTTAIIASGGSSSRMGYNKLMADLGGKTPLQLSYEAFVNSGVDRIIIPASPSLFDYALTLKSDVPTTVIQGGFCRMESIKNAILLCNHDRGDLILIHDAARCLVTPDIINEGIRQAHEHGSAIAATKVRDTVRRNDNTTLDRSSLLLMQTPQIFDADMIYRAYTEIDCSESITDDCELFMAVGGVPHYFDAGFMNQKLTYPEDIELFKAIISMRK